MKNDVFLLDCTLRDGGYVNDWKWGFLSAKDVIQLLVKANIDVVEVGFLRNVDNYDADVSVCNHIEELNRLLPDKTGNTMFSAMAMRSNYDISKLSPYTGSGIEMIRITAHDYDIKEGMDFAREVKEKGYKLSINPINIMGYSDKKILWLLEQVNDIQPYQFSIVDTFGSMKKKDFDRICSLVDNNLDRNIRVALHLHENKSMSFYLAQSFVNLHLNRPIAIDGSLMGMGRIPGNLPIELIADYLNEIIGKAYNIDFIMDAIQDYIAPLKGNSPWGYMPAYFLSARFNLHRNYAEHYLNKGDLTNKDINHILSRIDDSKKTAFDKNYADELYNEYKNNIIDDSISINKLFEELKGKNILVIAPGATIEKYRKLIIDYIDKEKPLIISVNFVPEYFSTDFAFFGNNKRYNNINKFACKTIVTSNINDKQAGYIINYNSISGAFDLGCNSFIMLLKLLKNMNVSSVTAAGADGYSRDKSNYYRTNIRSYETRGNKFNLSVMDAIHKLGIRVRFLTPSAYDESSILERK